MAADFDTARELFTKHPVMLHPATGKRVTPSAVIEYGAKEAAAANKAVAALAAQVKALADAPAGVVQMDDEQLERVLRKVLGSVDGVQS